ncbi:MAG: ABC transporter permease [Acidimicrobiales bacterium]
MTTSGPGRLVRVLAWRRIADRPLRSCLTATGVAAGVAFLFSVTSLNAQLASNARDTAAVLAGPRLLQITPASPGGLPDELAGQLANDARVAVAAPLLIARSTASSGSQETGVFVLGGTSEAPALAPDAVEEMETIDLSELPEDGRGIALTGRLARRLDVEVGGEIALHASSGITAMPVVAVVSSSPLDRINGGMAAAMQLDQAQQLFGRAGRVDQILLLATPDADLGALRRDIAAAIDGIGIVGSPGEAMGVRSSDFATVRTLTDLIGGLVLLAAVVLVFHTMTMATAERRTEIALARSLGSSRKQLLLVTLTETALLGGAGTAVGLVAGGALARFVVPLARYAYGGGSPVDVPGDVSLQLGPAVVAAAAGIIATVLGAVIPARSAARAAPIDAFRHTATYEWRDPTRPTHRLARAAAGAAILSAGVVLALRRASGDPTDPRGVLPVVAVYVGALILVPTAVPFAARAAATLLGRVSTTTGRLAGDALRDNPRRTTVNVMALLLPVTTVIMTAVAFSSGLTEIGRLARAAVAAPLNVDAASYVGGPAGAVAPQPLAPAHQSVLEAVPGVRAVLPYENANISLPDQSNGVVYAIPLVAAQRAGVADMVDIPRPAAGPVAFRERLAAGEIAASHFAARSLGLEPGSRVTLPTPSGPRVFTVGALFDDWAFQGTFYIDLDAYRAIWGDDLAYRYAIVPTAGASIHDLRQRLVAAVADAAMPARVHTRDEAVAQLEASTTSLLPLMRGITLASLVFAALALANAAFTAVTERRWTFALQRTLGMTRRQITRSLALEAVAIGVIGAGGAAVVGLPLGFFTTRFLADRLATTLPNDIPWVLVVGSTVLGVAVAASATSYPRRVAKRLPIIESLRFE